MASTFAVRLRELRKEAGLTQEELGRRLGTDRSTITAYETEKRTPDPETVARIADLFRVSIDYLMGRTDNPERTAEKVWPEGWRMIRRAGRVSPEKKRLILRLIESVLAEEEEPKKQ